MGATLAIVMRASATAVPWLYSSVTFTWTVTGSLDRGGEATTARAMAIHPWAPDRRQEHH